jgi:ParB family chromosome partitioning protein
MPDMQMIPLEKIIAGKNQPRQTFYEESLQELAQSIKERGVLEPIVVRPAADGRYEIVMGERRYRAAQMAGLTEIPAIVRELSDEEAAADALLENFQREDLNPIERAQAIQRLLTMMSWEQVARTLGVSESTLQTPSGAAGTAAGHSAGADEAAFAKR